MKRKQKCIVCPDCKGTGEQWDNRELSFGDDATAVNISFDSPDCDRCLGEGVVYEKISFVDNFFYGLEEQADFVTDEFCEQFITMRNGVAY